MKTFNKHYTYRILNAYYYHSRKLGFSWKNNPSNKHSKYTIHANHCIKLSIDLNGSIHATKHSLSNWENVNIHVIIHPENINQLIEKLERFNILKPIPLHATTYKPRVKKNTTSNQYQH